jgi:hypothetical protein
MGYAYGRPHRIDNADTWFRCLPFGGGPFKERRGIYADRGFRIHADEVGIITLPLEMKIFGKRASIVRNIAGFVFSLVVAFVMGTVLG